MTVPADSPEPPLAVKLLITVWMMAAATSFILVSLSPGSAITAAIPQFLMPVRDWLLAIFQAPALY